MCLSMRKKNCKIRNAIFFRISEHFPTEEHMICSSFLDLKFGMTFKLSIVHLPPPTNKSTCRLHGLAAFSVTLNDVIK